MARKIENLTISKSNRDNSKTFQIKEMSVNRADKWANTALLAMLRGGVDVGNVNFGLIMDTLGKSGAPKVDPMGGMLELARISIAGLGNVTDVVGQELLDQLVNECVKVVTSNGSVRDLIMPDINNPDDETEGDIEELSTLWELRKTAFTLHIDFLADGSSQI